MHRNKSVNVHQFAMTPRADIPRSSFQEEHMHKTTFDSGWLIPILIDEVLPGDSFNLRMTAFARLATPLFPIMDNIHLDSFFFFIPNRLIWDNWKKFNGEQRNPGDSTSFLIPKMTTPAGGYAVNSIYDYMGLPTVGQMGGGATFTHMSLPLRAYNLVWNEWFRDENLQNSVVNPTGDGPDLPANFTLLKRGKRHDYFTSALPWPQKGTSVSLPLGTQAPIKSQGTAFSIAPLSNPADGRAVQFGGSNAFTYSGGAIAGVPQATWGPVGATATGLYADLSAATAATINQLRQSFQIQKLLERDARGGTRYTEILRSHFGVISPDARLQRPEYLGGGSTPVSINPIAQTGPTGTTGSTTPMGQLAAMGTVIAPGHGFSQSFTEHGFVLGLISVRADLTYQQGVRRMWNRDTRFDFYWPAFAMLGEQTILNKEIYVQGTAADDQVFGYQERWAEYRYFPSQVTGYFRSTAATTLDPWHLAQKFASLPTLNATFIEENPPIDRMLAVPSQAIGKQFLCDAFFSTRKARPMPLYSVPGLIDHF